MSKEILSRGLPAEHPGIILKELYVLPMELNITALATTLKVSRVTVSKLLHAKQSISADMAIRLSKAFNTSAAYWLNLQQDYDLWNAASANNLHIETLMKNDTIHKTQRPKTLLDKRQRNRVAC